MRSHADEYEDVIEYLEDGRQRAYEYSKGLNLYEPDHWEYWKEREGLSEPKANEADKASVPNEAEATVEADKADVAENAQGGDIKPIGRGVFGNIYDQFRGKAKEALAFLKRNKQGDLLGVFHRDEIGDVDLVWGDEKAGLSHINSKHVGTGKSFISLDSAVEHIDNIIKTGAITFINGDKVVIKKGDELVTLRKNVRENGKKIADKNWILTAYNEKAVDDTSAISVVNKGQAAPTTAFPEGKDNKNKEIGKGGAEVKVSRRARSVVSLSDGSDVTSLVNRGDYAKLGERLKSEYPEASGALGDEIDRLMDFTEPLDAEDVVYRQLEGLRSPKSGNKLLLRGDGVQKGVREELGLPTVELQQSLGINAFASRAGGGISLQKMSENIASSIADGVYPGISNVSEGEVRDMLIEAIRSSREPADISYHRARRRIGMAEKLCEDYMRESKADEERWAAERDAYEAYEEHNRREVEEMLKMLPEGGLTAIFADEYIREEQIRKDYEESIRRSDSGGSLLQGARADTPRGVGQSESGRAIPARAGYNLLEGADAAAQGGSSSGVAERKAWDATREGVGVEKDVSSAQKRIEAAEAEVNTNPTEGQSNGSNGSNGSNSGDAIQLAQEAIAEYERNFSSGAKSKNVILESPEELYNFAIKAGESEEDARAIAEHFSKKSDATGYYDTETDQVVIFARNGGNPYLTAFHENVHRAVYKLGGAGAFGSLVAELKELDGKLLRNIQKSYPSEKISDEMIAYSLEAALSGNAIKELRGYLLVESKSELDKILNYIGYDERRDSKADAGRYATAEAREFERVSGRTRRLILARQADGKRDKDERIHEQDVLETDEARGEAARSERAGIPRGLYQGSRETGKSGVESGTGREGKSLTTAEKEVKDARVAEKRATERTMQLLEKTGVPVEMAPPEMVQSVLGNNHANAEFSRVYHGSGAKFDRFDHSHMGEGEGVQAYGWGTYVTEVEGIGRTYAVTMRDKAISEKHKENAVINRLARQTLDSNNGDKKASLEYLNSLLNEDWSDKKRVKAQIKIIETGRFLPETKVKAHLYTVEIPDDNGSNYLHWDGIVSDGVVERLQSELQKAFGEDTAMTANLKYGQDGEHLYKKLERALGSDKAASEFLSTAGFAGISYPAEAMRGGRADKARNYVIFNEDSARITDRAEFLRTNDGTVYGWAIGGKIYLAPEGVNPNTPVHEYTHLWAKAIEKSYPKKWANIVEGLKQSPVWSDVAVDENYRNIWGDDNRIASEVLARLSGEENYRREMERAEAEINGETSLIDKNKKQTAWKRVKRALNDFWNKVKGMLGLPIKGDSAGDVPAWRKFVDMAVGDFYKGVNPNEKNVAVKTSVSHKPEFMFIGERGTAALDRAHEASVRLDNLTVAREIERKFGEKKGRIEKLRSSEPIEIDFKNEYELNRDSAKQWLKDNIRGEYVNKDTGETISISKVGINEVTSHGTQDKAHLISLKAIPDFIEESIFIDEIENTKDNNKYDSYRYYVCGAKIGGEDYTVKIVVGVRGDNKYYDHRLIEIEKGSLIDNLNGLSNSVAENQRTSFDVKDSKLVSILQVNDKENAKRIKAATGWERGADGKWRYEVGDKRLKDGWENRADKVTGVKLRDVIEDKELFVAYPELNDVYLSREETTGEYGSYDPIKKRIIISNKILVGAESTLVHEVQHIIQHIEGFATGGSAKAISEARRLNNKVQREVESLLNQLDINEWLSRGDIQDVILRNQKEGRYFNLGYAFSESLDEITGYALRQKLDEANRVIAENNRMIGGSSNLSPSEHYRRLGGEVEARNVSRRMGMSVEERRNSLAEDTEDVSRADQIFIMGGLGSSERAERADVAADDVLYRSDEKTEYEDIVRRMKSQYVLRGGGQSIAIYEAADLERVRMILDKDVYEKIESKYHEPNVLGCSLPKMGYAFIFTNKAPNVESTWWHENTHIIYESLELADKEECGLAALNWLQKQGESGKEHYSHATSKYEQSSWGEEGATRLVQYLIETYGAEIFLNSTFDGNEKISKLANAIRNKFIYGKEEPTRSDILQRRRIAAIYGISQANGGMDRGGRESSSSEGRVSLRSGRYGESAGVQRNAETQYGGGGEAERIEIREREGAGAYSDRAVTMASDPRSKAIGRPLYGEGKRMREYAARQRRMMAEQVGELAEKLHLDNVEIVTDASSLEGKKARAKGFYSRSAGKITVVIPNHGSVSDAVQTLLHEAVAHHGLRKLFGEHFDTFLDNVYNNADAGIHERIDDMASKNGGDFRKATEEYLAGLAEKTNFEDARTSGWWSKIKEFFMNLLHKIGFKGFKGVTLTDNELRYILWRSYMNLKEPGKFRSILGEAEDIARQEELRVGNYGKDSTTSSVAAEVGGRYRKTYYLVYNFLDLAIKAENSVILQVDYLFKKWQIY